MPLQRNLRNVSKRVHERPGRHCLKLLGTSFQELDASPISNTMATPARTQCSAVLEHFIGKVNEQHCRACEMAKKYHEYDLIRGSHYKLDNHQQLSMTLKKLRPPTPVQTTRHNKPDTNN